MGLSEAAHTRSIDKRQPAPQQRAGRADLDPQHLAATGVRSPTHIGADVIDGNVNRCGCPVGPGGQHKPGRRLGAVAYDGDHHGGLVIAYSRRGQVEQRIEQLTLALFEQPGDHHTDLRVGDPLASPRQPLY
ncbi:Uncharacterised protein [Mycobacterium tuberculosis]|uniref:Uncharacterized protein n=1 Tax=Mycobacterium tuberculosis TaxID=1773 RepID=A0A655JT76_MYCTX|nr:Uncharacterised protein [Mycobacterium tuberculosis]CKT73611.1 Uncharacterised protein [Mycobacterium tuberculosis]CKV43442.1 Uncharacterised protein [Mycobacterium tuberculosis]CNX45130.1 Uncharacterised protein [Mycobacterium tuberculosis]COW97346.1 Uncharacterised protein [Mycobacterium tuberculosis]